MLKRSFRLGMHVTRRVGWPGHSTSHRTIEIILPELEDRSCL